jgi:hypothetical protein
MPQLSLAGKDGIFWVGNFALRIGFGPPDRGVRAYYDRPVERQNEEKVWACSSPAGKNEVFRRIQKKISFF